MIDDNPHQLNRITIDKLTPMRACTAGVRLPGSIQACLSKIQALLKTILQFSRTKNLGKILIKVLKFYFGNARLR